MHFQVPQTIVYANSQNWEKKKHVSLLCLLLVSHRLIKQMKKKKGGGAVLITSFCMHFTRPFACIFINSVELPPQNMYDFMKSHSFPGYHFLRKFAQMKKKTPSKILLTHTRSNNLFANLKNAYKITNSTQTKQNLFVCFSIN